MDIRKYFDKAKSAAKKVPGFLASARHKLTPHAIKGFFMSLPEKVKGVFSGRKHSLMTWLSICFFSFSLIILVVLFAIQTLFYGSFYKAIKTKNITNCASVIIENLDYNSGRELMSMISKQNDIDIILCENDEFANFKQLYASFVTSDSVIATYTTKEFNAQYILAKNNSGSYITVIDEPKINKKELRDSGKEFSGDLPVLEHDSAERIIYAACTVDEYGEEYLLLLESLVTPSRSTSRTLLLQLRIMLVVLFAISVIMTVIFSKMISKPLVNINRTARELGEGNYDVQFNGGGYREVEQLSETLNYATNELRQVDQMRMDLIANVSHDLRTPLTLITGYGEVMRDIPGENTPENIQIIIDEATRLSSLVNDLIDLSKIEAGTMKVEASVFCITDTIKEMFGRYNKLKEQDGFSFTLEHDQDVYVYADQLKISQVIYNLVNNAVNYAGDNKEITVRQICYDNRVRIEVIDNGPGIPPDKLKNIWDRYYKVDKSHKSAKIGTGLGLSIVKTVLKLHKAQYGVFSKVGKGTVFWFELYRTTKDGEPM